MLMRPWSLFCPSSARFTHALHYHNIQGDDCGSDASLLERLRASEATIALCVCVCVLPCARGGI